MNRALAQHLLEQLRTGLLQPEELTEPEIIEVIALNREQPASQAVDLELRLQQAGRLPATFARS